MIDYPRAWLALALTLAVVTAVFGGLTILAEGPPEWLIEAIPTLPTVAAPDPLAA